MRARPQKGNPIPTRSREMLAARDRGSCFRCGLHGTDWHHRRSRRVRDDHTHCPCNGITLCRACHDAVHARPADARDLGLIVPRDTTEPGRVAVKGFMGWVTLRCDGTSQPVLFPGAGEGV